MIKFSRKFTEKERIKFVEEALEVGSNDLIAKKYDLNRVLLSRWKCNYQRYGKTLEPKEPKEGKIIPNYKKEYKKMQKQLEEKDLEIEVLRDLLKKKNLL